MNEQSQNTGLAKLVTDANELVNVFKSLEEFVGYIRTSIFAKNFEKNDPETGKVIIDDSDIITNIVLGSEAGLKPMESVMLGKRLTLEAYGAIKLGRDLGLPYHIAMSKIFTFNTKAGPTYAISAEIYTLLCNMYNVQRITIKDFEPSYSYYQISKENPRPTVALDEDEAFDKNGNLRRNILWMRTGIGKSDVTAHEELCDTLGLPVIKVIRKESNRTTSIRFIRKDIKFDEVISYSLQDAIDDGLYPGVTRRGEVLTNITDGVSIPAGKDNWIKKPRAMLMARVISSGTRACVPERTINTLGYDEAINISDVNASEETVSNAMNQSAEEAEVITND